MNSKQRKIIESLFEDPIRKNIKWTDFENLMSSLGAEINQRKGSKVAISLNDVNFFLDRPHPQNELKRYQIMAIRDFLINTGIVTEKH